MLNQRLPHPTEPDVFDDRRELADAIFHDQVATLNAGRTGKDLCPYMSALYWLGYRKWGIATSLTTLDSPRRRRRLLNAFHGKPFYAELERHLNGIGWQRPPDRECEERVAYFECYCDITEDGRVLFGLRDTPGRELRFKAHCERVELIVIDGGDHVARAVAPADSPYEGITSIQELGLTDDDYRFEVSAVKDTWWFGQLRAMRHTGKWFDYAEIDGDWVELEAQGRDWDGEWAGSTRVHTAANLPKEEEKENNQQAEIVVRAEQERAKYAARKAEANMRVVAMAQRNFNGDKLMPSRGYGANWFRTLWALGYRPHTWHGSLVQSEPTEPFTSADARREVKIWDGWIPFAEEIERLEKMETNHD